MAIDGAERSVGCLKRIRARVASCRVLQFRCLLNSRPRASYHRYIVSSLEWLACLFMQRDLQIVN